MKQIIYLIPVHNKEAVIKDSINKIISKFNKSNFELHIICVENGSKDNSFNVLRELSSKDNRITCIESQIGFGNAISTGLNHITNNLNYKNNFLIITGADLPFGFSDIDFVINNFQALDQDIFIGSKMHNNSIIKRTFTRNFMSIVFNYLIFLFFNLDVKDTQGSIIFNQRKVNISLLKPESSGFFSSAEILIKAKNYNYKIKEIPVTHYHNENDISTVRIFSDSFDMLSQLIKYKFIHKNYLFRQN